MATEIPNENELLEMATRSFVKTFHYEPKIAACAPGRVNLIGEHTDYNGGLVLPMALPLVTVIVGCYNGTGSSEIITSNADGSDEAVAVFDMPHYCQNGTTESNQTSRKLTPGQPKWANYVKGVVANFNGLAKGFDAAVVTSVPIGGGLSSSAALEVAMFTFLEALTGTTDISPTDKALACQRAEHEFAGMPCGIMDQFISVMGEAGHALLIDCRSLSASLIPVASASASIDSDGAVVVLITNSNVKHELTGSEYSTRRNQCHAAANELKLSSLRDAKLDDLTVLEEKGIDEKVIRRARHVISEIQRTQKAAEALQYGDYTTMGKLMNASHESLRQDFEVSCPELDQLVELARQVPGVLGSRMTGGGFGGCTVSLVKQNSVQQVIKTIQDGYRGAATFYVCQPSDGAKILRL